MNPNTPVVIGVGQVLQRVSDPLEGEEPVDLMVSAALKAAADTGNADLLSGVDSVRVIRGAWRYKHPAGYVAEKIGAPQAETVGTCFGGNMVQSTINESAKNILSGDNSLILITGAENGNSQAKARKKDLTLPLKETTGSYSRMIGVEEKMSNEAEVARGIQAPIQMYPIFENAIRHERGEGIEEHQGRVSELWSRFNDVALDNPNAWIQEDLSAEAIRTAGPTNRMVSFPYPKLMNSNNAVDMSAAVLMCSVARARELGVDESKWVYLWAGTDAHDTYYVSERDNLYSSPAIRIAGGRVLSMTGLGVDDLDYVDVYSCFPSAVQVAAKELGLDDARPLTVTGGLTFGGGPLNNYVMHSVATMIDTLREHPGTKGMITANGGFLTKHAFGIYSTQPPATDFQHQNVQAEVDLEPTREYLVDFEGEVVIESYTVMYGPEGPMQGHAACLTADGKRTWANTSDQDMMQAMTESEFCGRRAVINQGEFTLS